MIKALIIDDEPRAREFLAKVIDMYFQKKIEIMDRCDSVASGVAAIHKWQPELVFLDIQMPGENGFALFKHFETVNFEVIFTTAYDDFAIDAIRHSALDYLLKPINYIDLLSAIKRYEQRQVTVDQQQKISRLYDYISTEENVVKVALPTQTGFEFVNLNAIMYCKSESNYCHVMCSDGKTLFLAKTLKYMEEQLDSKQFVRVHKSYLVNLNYVARFDKGLMMKITLNNGDEVPVSLRKKETFLNAMLAKK